MNKPTNPLDTLGMPTTRRQSRMLDPVLLLLLLEHEGACGYDLAALAGKLPLSGGRTDGAAVYRCLRSFERDRLVKSEWDTEGGGPAKRRYYLTEFGIKSCRLWADQLKQRRNLLDDYLARYRKAIPLAMQRQQRRAKARPAGTPPETPPKRGRE